MSDARIDWCSAIARAGQRKRRAAFPDRGELSGVAEGRQKMCGLQAVRLARGLQIGERRNLAGWLVQAVHQEGLAALVVEIDGRFPSPAPGGGKENKLQFR